MMCSSNWSLSFYCLIKVDELNVYNFFNQKVIDFDLIFQISPSSKSYVLRWFF